MRGIIKDSNGNVPAQNKEGTGGSSSSSDWALRTFNVSAYAGEIITIEIYLEDLSTTWAGNGDHSGWISEEQSSSESAGGILPPAVDDFSVT